MSEPVIEKGNVITLEVPKYDKNGKITKSYEKVDASFDYATVKVKAETNDKLFRAPIYEVKVLVDTVDIPNFATSAERRAYENKIQAWLREDFFVRNPSMLKKLNNAKNSDEKNTTENKSFNLNTKKIHTLILFGLIGGMQ